MPEYIEDVDQEKWDAAISEVETAIAEERAKPEAFKRHPYGECCPLCAEMISQLWADMQEMAPTIRKMGEMFLAIETARESNPMVARLFGMGNSQPKESRKDRKSRLAEIQEMGEDSDDA